MDFPRNNPNFVGNAPNGNDGAATSGADGPNANFMDPDILRRLATSRGPGHPLGQEANSMGIGPGGMMSNSSRLGPNGMPNQLGPMNAAAGQMAVGPQQNVMGAPQGDREEELLFQILLARRRRQGMHPDMQQSEQDLSGQTDSQISEELMRLRQMAGNARGAQPFQSNGNFNPAMDPNQQRFQQPQMNGMFPSMFPNGPAFNFPANQQMQMMQDQANANVLGGNVPPNMRFDELLYRGQNQQTQDALFNAFNNGDQQRLEPSQRLFQLSQPGKGIFDFTNRVAFGDEMKTSGGDLGKMEVPHGDLGSKKKRYHKKKPSDMPRRPLSAYNLFFSEERERILQEIDSKDGTKGGAAKTEDGDATAKGADGAEDASASTKKPKALLRPLLPSQKKRRPHRKTHGKISFRQLAQMVGQRWKALPADRKEYYQGLAKEDMVRQKKAMEEYYVKQSTKVKGKTEETSGSGDNQVETTPVPIS